MSLSHYTQKEQDKLKLLGFNWVESDDEWFNDKRRIEYAIHFDSWINEYQLRTSGYNWLGDYYEDYDCFKSFDELIEFIA